MPTDHDVLVVDTTGLGDRFAAPLGAPRDPGWRDSGDLFGAALAATLDAGRAARGTGSAAVVGQLLFEQFAMRLAAPVVAAYVRDGALLDARPPRVRALLDDDGLLHRLAFDRAPEPGADRAAVVASLREGLEPHADAVHRHTRVGLRTLRGGMANAVANAFLHVSWPQPDPSRYVGEARAVLAAAPGWAPTVGVSAVEAGGENWMYTDRNTCCLAFRTAAQRERRYCPTCPVTPRDTLADMFTRATESYRERHPR